MPTPPLPPEGRVDEAIPPVASGDVRPRCPWGGVAEPSTILAFLACDPPPDREAVLARIGAAVEAVVPPRGMAPPDPRMRWAGVLEDRGGPILAWLEAAEPPEPDARMENPAGLGACRWVVGVQALIEAPAIAERWSGLIRSAALLPGVASLLDPATGRWVAGETLAAAGEAEWLAPSDWAWSTRSVRRQGSDAVWLFTEGLRRWGRPELEMLEVPDRLASAGAALLDLLSPLLLEASPAPDTRWQVGPSAWVTLQEIAEVAPRLAEHAAGSLADRRRIFGDSGGSRAVVCDPSPRGAYARVWVPPLALLEEILRGGGEFFRSRQDAAIARVASRRRVAEWLDLLAGFDGAIGEEVRVRMRIEDGADEPRGLRSFEVSEIAGDRVIAMPIDPASGAAVLAPAMALPLARLEADLADWVVLREGRSYAADEIDRFRRDGEESRRSRGASA